MKHKYGIAWADKYLGMSLWKNQEEKADEFTEEERKKKMISLRIF